MSKLIDYLNDLIRITSGTKETDSGWSEPPISRRYSSSYFANFYNKNFRGRNIENAD